MTRPLERGTIGLPEVKVEALNLGYDPNSSWLRLVLVGLIEFVTDVFLLRGRRINLKHDVSTLSPTDVEFHNSLSFEAQRPR